MDVGSLEYIASDKDTESGAYAVVITTAATQGTVTGSGFGGTYVDDATADTLTITDAGTASAYKVTLSNGLTMTQIVDAVNTQLQTATKRSLQATNVMKSDAGGTNATESTLLQDLFDSGGTNLGVADGDVFTISGASDDGTTFFKELTLTDVTTQTLGDLRAEIAKAVGTDVVLEITDGYLNVTAAAEGRKTFTLAVSSDNAGGGTFDFSTFAATEVGRGKAAITASDSGGELKLVHDEYGSGEGFTIAYAAGGTDGSSSLGRLSPEVGSVLEDLADYLTLDFRIRRQLTFDDRDASILVDADEVGASGARQPELRNHDPGREQLIGDVVKRDESCVLG